MRDLVYLVGGLPADWRVLQSTSSHLALAVDFVVCDGEASLPVSWTARPSALVFFLRPDPEHVALLQRVRTDPALLGTPLLCVRSDWGPDVDSALADRWFPPPGSVAAYERLAREVARLIRHPMA
jgi:hypothetical protein